MKLIDDWRSAWKYFSVHALLIAGVLPSVWATLPPDLKAYIPPSIMALITAVIAVSGIVGRLTDQSKKS